MAIFSLSEPARWWNHSIVRYFGKQCYGTSPVVRPHFCPVEIAEKLFDTNSGSIPLLKILAWCYCNCLQKLHATRNNLTNLSKNVKFLFNSLKTVSLIQCCLCWGVCNVRKTGAEEPKSGAYLVQRWISKNEYLVQHFIIHPWQEEHLSVLARQLTP